LTSEVKDFEARQNLFDADPNDQLLAIGADAAPTYFRWVLARRIEAEGNTAGSAEAAAVIGLGPAPDLAYKHDLDLVWFLGQESKLGPCRPHHVGRSIGEWA